MVQRTKIECPSTYISCWKSHRPYGTGSLLPRCCKLSRRRKSTSSFRTLLLLTFLSIAISFPSYRIEQITFCPSTKSTSKPPVYHIEPLSWRQTGKFSRTTAATSSSHSNDQSSPNIPHNITTTKIKGNKEKNKISINKIDGIESELSIRTREYRRRKHEWAKRYTSQEGLRDAFGGNRNRLWGDLDARTGRQLYKSLLFPTAISELVLELGDECVRPEELAPLAYEARKAAKMYVRERCRVPSRVGAYLFDGFRQLRKYGKFQPNGASYEQLWVRYYKENGNITKEEFNRLIESSHNNQETLAKVDNEMDDNIIDDVDDAVTEDEIIKRTCKKILEKSCTTNDAIDRFYLNKYGDPAMPEDKRVDDLPDMPDIKKVSFNRDKEKRGRAKGWKERKERKKRYNDLLLKRITQTLERDVRKLLEPPPVSETSNIVCEADDVLCDNSRGDDHGGNEDIRSRRDREWSSRRMTKQEYHSLKLFAKARKTLRRQESVNLQSKNAMKQGKRNDGKNDTFNRSVDVDSKSDI